MLTFDDLLIARILSRQHRELRGALLILLADLRDGAIGRGLLTTVLQERIISRDSAAQAQILLTRYKRGRALGIFTHLLAAGGLDRALVEDHARAGGPAVTVVQLGEDLVSRGLISQEVNRRAQFQARVLFDRDQRRQLEEHLVSTPIRPKGTTPAALESRRFNHMAQLPDLSSGVFRLEETVPTPSAQEVEELVESSSTGLDSLLSPPSFSIPDWVDTSVLAAGMLMIGDYRILGRIGHGGMATVYLAHLLSDHERAIALKVLRDDASEEALGRFKREGVAASLFSHVNVLDLYQVGEERGQHFMAMEFFDGLPLQEHLEQRQELSVRDSLRIAQQLLLGLAAVHGAHVVHRDVKPANLLVSEDLQELRLIDFGIARVEKLGGLEDRVFQTQGTGLLGTPRYMSPEQAAGDALDARSDLYSVGLVLHEMLAGDSPFSADSPMGFVACHIKEAPRPIPPELGVPPGVQSLVSQLLRKEPDERPQSAGAACELVDALLGSLG